MYDELVFEDGLFQASLNPESSIQHYKSSDLVTDEDRRSARVVPHRMAGFRLDLTIEGPDGRPLQMPFGSGKLVGHYAAEWMSGVTDELERIGAGWAHKLTMADEDVANVGLASLIDDLAGRLSGAEHGAYSEPIVASWAANALARDLVIAGRLDATVQVTSLFEPLLDAVSACMRTSRKVSGEAALGIVVPHVALLPWETIAAFREHPGCHEARARLREIEERAATEGLEDALAFQRRVSQEVTSDLFAVVDDLEGSVGMDIARHAAGVVSLVPFATEIAAVGEAAVAAHRRRRSWRAALMKLRAVVPQQ